ncbi:hypothetical protein OVY01_14295 [Robbsia sp. Bb-Pol-6]|uniref:Type VI secretion system protein n=1 Tax=Robbsia betulipollinis TaxID=2981849 RepID=A0ABT3ZR15_9BURK|nr:hypothetical protein [Robbsia betulipollinis]MCY0388385.1 hypothetical protein [Robbsia betulipollinis]
MTAATGAGRARPAKGALRWCLVAGALCLPLCLLHGCASPGPKRVKANWREVTLIAAADANRNSPVAVDLVLVSDAKALDGIMTLSAAQWFATRGDLLATFPDGIRCRGWEIVPGQTITSVERVLPSGKRIVAALVFARYESAGAHRARLDRYDGRLVLTFQEETFTVLVTK